MFKYSRTITKNLNEDGLATTSMATTDTVMPDKLAIKPKNAYLKRNKKNTLRAMKEARIEGSWKGGRRPAAGSRFNTELEIDHEQEIKDIEKAMKQYPSNDQNIKNAQLARIAFHKSKLEK